MWNFVKHFKEGNCFPLAQQKTILDNTITHAKSLKLYSISRGKALVVPACMAVSPLLRPEPEAAKSSVWRLPQSGHVHTSQVSGGVIIRGLHYFRRNPPFTDYSFLLYTKFID